MSKSKDTRKTYIANVYCPLQGNGNNALKLIENKVFKLLPNNSNVVIISDLNIDLLKPSTADSKAATHTWKMLKFIQVNKEATRITQTSRTLVNHVIVD